MHRGSKHRRCCGFRGVRLVAHAKLTEDFLSIGQNIHQMADRRALIAADIADACFQKRFGQRQNALAGECLTVSDLELLDFLGE
jgi:hypothetical protein